MNRGQMVAQITARRAFITHAETLSGSPGERIAERVAGVEFQALAAIYPGQTNPTYTD